MLHSSTLFHAYCKQLLPVLLIALLQNLANFFREKRPYCFGVLLLCKFYRLGPWSLLAAIFSRVVTYLCEASVAVSSLDRTQSRRTYLTDGGHKGLGHFYYETHSIIAKLRAMLICLLKTERNRKDPNIIILRAKSDMQQSPHSGLVVAFCRHFVEHFEKFWLARGSSAPQHP